ncbi:MAG: hypothetical protein C4519_24320 [Desulfobacteraceae bacterium]|nr:MAG: hypothetical protein C4519_24320 [Desulfobacteraceae bacterium]
MADKKKKLNAKQEKFCKLYASDEEFFCNGVQAYIEAYQPKRVGNWYNSAKSSAFNLLTKTDILSRIDELLELRGLNDSFVDKQLEKLITQDADFKSKLGAIKEYNELKKRILKKIELTPSEGFSIKISTVSDGDRLAANKKTE